MPKVNSIFVIHFLPGEYFWNIVFKFQVKNERASETTFTKIFNVGMLQMFLNYQKSIEIWMNIWGTFKNSPRRWVNCLLFKNPQLILLSLLWLLGFYADHRGPRTYADHEFFFFFSFELNQKLGFYANQSSALTLDAKKFDILHSHFSVIWVKFLDHP